MMEMVITVWVGTMALISPTAHLLAVVNSSINATAAYTLRTTREKYESLLVTALCVAHGSPSTSHA